MNLAQSAAEMARRYNIPPKPSPFAPDAEWTAWHRARRKAVPPWYVDRGYVNGYALEYLPRVTAALDLGEAVAALPRPRWWFSLTLPDHLAGLHGTRLEGARPTLALRLTADSDDLLFIDRATGEWDVPNLCRGGEDLVELVAWRLDLSPTKAGWRIAKICGLRRPLP
jgi:hypothetical protein